MTVRFTLHYPHSIDYIGMIVDLSPDGTTAKVATQGSIWYLDCSELTPIKRRSDWVETRWSD